MADQPDQGEAEHRTADRDPDPQHVAAVGHERVGDRLFEPVLQAVRDLGDQVLWLAWQPPRLG